MKQEILVGFIVAVALVGFFRYIYRKWKILKKNKKYSACEECPLREKCNCMNSNPKRTGDSCSCS